MAHRVLKPFRTPTRVFAIDQEIAEADIAGPLSFADWVARGFIGADAPAIQPIVAAVETSIVERIEAGGSLSSRFSRSRRK